MSNQHEDYQICTNLRIDWSELNLFGHVSNVEFFKYIQSSRINYLEAIGLPNKLNDNSTGTILASTSFQFMKPLFYPGNIKILAKVDFIKNTSFGLTHLIMNEQDEIAGTGKDIIVMYDYNTNQKINIPATIRNNIQLLEKKQFEYQPSSIIKE